MSSDSPFPTRLAGSRPPGRRPPGTVLSRRTVALAATGATLLLAWSGAATWYILARDDLAQRFFSHQAELRYAYEDRLADLRGRLERETTQNLVERTGFQRRADTLATRQGEIEARQIWLRQIAERTVAGADPARPAAGPPEAWTAATSRGPGLEGDGAAQPGMAKPAPLADGLGFPLRRSSEALPDPSGPVRADRAEAVPALVAPAGRQPSPRDRLSGLELGLDRVAVDELRLVDLVRRNAQARAARIRGAIEAAGLDPDRLSQSPAGAALGGPLVPLPDGAQPFLVVAAEAEARSAELVRLRAAVRTLPLTRPLAGEAEQTSGFGYRVDPFTRGMALHTGLDLRTETGTAVRATGGGRVTEAEWSGGYGNMIEIDHGGGLATRYGHLSAIGVVPGQRIEPGQVIGRSGTTGRSTGPHLHYETRVNGEPVNPARFLQAGRLLALAETGR